MSALIPGQYRRAFRVSQILQIIWSREVFNPAPNSSYHQGEMVRTHVHIKVELEHGDDETPDKLAAEICRQLLKNYAVRTAEVSSLVTEH